MRALSRILIGAGILCTLSACSDDETPIAIPTATEPAPSPQTPQPSPTGTSVGATPPAAETETPTPTCATAMPVGSPTMTPTPAATDTTATPTCATPMPVTPGEFGALLDEEEFDSSPETLPPYAFGAGVPSPPPTYKVLENLPAVAEQGTPQSPGSPGTCEAQSFGRGLGTYTAAQFPDGTPKFDPSTPENIASAAFLWSIAVAEGVASCPKGGGATGYLQRLTAYGSASEAQVPYQPNCCYLGGIDPAFAWPDQDKFRIGSYSTFQIRMGQLTFMKNLIAAGHAIAFSGYVIDCYDNPALEFGVFGSNTGPQPHYRNPSGHGQLIVGYDDQKGNPAAPGAFLVQNSFGTAWPSMAPGGRVWWAFETLLTTQLLAAVAYPVNPATPSSGELATQLTSPAAYVTGVQHWTSTEDIGSVYLILQLHFTAPVLLQQVALTEPDTGTVATQTYGLPIGDGYVYLRREDGHQFLNGTWGLELTVENLAAQQGTFSGDIAVGPSVPTTPTPAPVPSIVYDTIGNEATVVIPPTPEAAG